MTTADAISNCLISEDVPSRSLNQANVVDALAYIANGTSGIAKAITADAAPAQDATGGTVASLTEAVMGMTASLLRIAEAIDGVAEKLSGRI